MATVSFAQLLDWMVRWDGHLIEQRVYLGELDSAIGDADHGANMVRGLAAASAKVDAESPEFLDDLFKAVGMALISSVGGASGPLFGTFFLRFANSAGHVTELGGAEFSDALILGLAGLAERGKVELGDKTMYDALYPAVEGFATSFAESGSFAEAARYASRRAHEGQEATAPMIARKGRASYLGERSIGHLDPGATSAALLFQALAEALA